MSRYKDVKYLVHTVVVTRGCRCIIVEGGFSRHLDASRPSRGDVAPGTSPLKQPPGVSWEIFLV